jgi:predicted 3-demethylubiquinone-9 3-methyltransferase (glyoxalase superfamily)
MKKITPFLWFDDQAEQAAKYYTSIFKDSKITGVQRYGASGPGKKGSVMTVQFRLHGQDFVALNGGPHFSFSPAVSFYVDCKDQKEVDRLWNKLLRGGEAQQCGWLKDKYGVSWQIIPSVLGKLLYGKDKARSERVMAAMLKMVKLDVAALQAAGRG